MAQKMNHKAVNVLA